MKIFCVLHHKSKFWNNSNSTTIYMVGKSFHLSRSRQCTQYYYYTSTQLFTVSLLLGKCWTYAHQCTPKLASGQNCNESTNTTQTQLLRIYIKKPKHTKSTTVNNGRLMCYLKKDAVNCSKISIVTSKNPSSWHSFQKGFYSSQHIPRTTST